MRASREREGDNGNSGARENHRGDPQRWKGQPEVTGCQNDHTTAETRAVVFCWGNSSLVHRYVRFLKYLREKLQCRFLVVTEHVRGRLLFAGYGIDALTLADAFQMSSDEQLSWNPENRDPIYPTEFEEAAGFLGGGTSTFNDAEVNHEYHRLYDWLVRAFAPHWVITWNGGLLCQWALAAVGRHYDLPTFFVERGLFPDTFFVDPQGVNFAASVAGDRWPPASLPAPSDDDLSILQRQLDDYERHGQSVVNAGVSESADKIRSALGIPIDARVCLFPLQIELDTNIRRFSPLFENMADAVVALENALKAVPGVYLIVKPHPENILDQSLVAERLDSRVCLTTDFDLYSLLHLCDAVVTINSTVGLEARSLGKPTVTLGDSIYSGKGFTVDLRSMGDLMDDLRRVFSTIGDSPEGQSFLEAFLVFLFKNRLFSLTKSDSWRSRSSIAGQIIDAGVTGLTRSTSDVRLARLLKENRKLGSWIEQENGETIQKDRKFVLIGTPPEYLEGDVFEKCFRSTCVVSTIQNLIGAILESWVRPFDVALLIDKPSRKRRLALRFLRVRDRVQVL